MKLVYRRSSSATALAEPAEVYASETAQAEPSPAPTGALHRVYPQEPVTAAHAGPAGAGVEDEYVPQRGSYGMRLRGGLPLSVAGRVLAGSVVLVLLGLVTLLVAEVRHFLLHDPRFTLASSAEISVEGNEHISRADVLGVFGADLERNVFRIPMGERRADLERLPWVSHATIERLLPHQLRVLIAERTPIAFARVGSHIGLVDADGVLLDMPPASAGDPRYSFPVLTGLAAGDSAELRGARMEVYQRFMAELGEQRTRTLSEVDVTNPEDVKALVTLGGADVLVHFGDEAFVQRFEAFAQHLPAWRMQYPKLAAADMRYERQVVLEMAGGVTPLAGDDPVSGVGASGEKGASTAGARRPAVAAGGRERAGGSTAGERVARALAVRRAGEQARIKMGERR